MPTKGLSGKTALAYAAGIIDGEGTICLIKTNRKVKQGFVIYLQVRVGNTNEWLIYWLKMQFGGNIQYYVSKFESHRPGWHWYIDRRRAVDFLTTLLPYLQIKRPQAELAIQFQSRKKRGPINEGQAVIEEAERILMKSFNKGGKEK